MWWPGPPNHFQGGGCASFGVWFLMSFLLVSIRAAVSLATLALQSIKEQTVFLIHFLASPESLPLCFTSVPSNSEFHSPVGPRVTYNLEGQILFGTLSWESCMKVSEDWSLHRPPRVLRFPLLMISQGRYHAHGCRVLLSWGHACVLFVTTHSLSWGDTFPPRCLWWRSCMLKSGSMMRWDTQLHKHGSLKPRLSLLETKPWPKGLFSDVRVSDDHRRMWKTELCIYLFNNVLLIKIWFFFPCKRTMYLF